MANIITGIRIIASVGLLFCPAFSSPFYGLYLLAGISDMIDGPVARRMGKASDFGAKLDTVADLVFAVVCLYKLLPALNIPVWLYAWIAVIALVKVVNVVSGYVTRDRFVAAHTTLNKVTGLLLFLLPLTIGYIDLRYAAPIICAVATLAAVQEGHFIRTGRTI